MASGTRSKVALNDEGQEQQKQLFGMLHKYFSLLPDAVGESGISQVAEQTENVKEQINTDELKELPRDQMLSMIISLMEENTLLKEENTSIKGVQKFMERTNERMEELERQQNLNSQYIRRDTIEISGIPPNIEQKDLEEEVIRIYDAAQVTVHDSKLDRPMIQACHRIGKKNVTIVKFVNRKLAYEGLVCSKNLKGNSPYDNAVYINNSLCREFKFLNFVVRQAKKDGKIHRYKMKHGVTLAQVEEGGDFVEISHKADLIKHGIATE